MYPFMEILFGLKKPISLSDIVVQAAPPRESAAKPCAGLAGFKGAVVFLEGTEVYLVSLEGKMGDIYHGIQGFCKDITSIRESQIEKTVDNSMERGRALVGNEGIDRTSNCNYHTIYGRLLGFIPYTISGVNLFNVRWLCTVIKY